jgi:TorA maturation chaperone TorD/Fe-S-cluster-containing hydrogenase component 2
MASESLAERRAALYQALAEALAEPPEWLAWPGPRWPLFEAAVGCAPFSPAAAQAAGALADLPAEALCARRARYAALFAGPGQPRLWLYESAALTGQLLGPQTWAVERLYRAAGLSLAGSELPDHAVFELAFLGHLAGQGEAALERGFIARHAGRWLPDLGRALAEADDPVYSPIGALLEGWLREAAEPARQRPSRRARPRQPEVRPAEACTLCGFCVQACPTRALTITETDARTELTLWPERCVGCARCERVCHAGVMRMTQAEHPSAGAVVLRGSPRPACRACGQALVSQAELDYVASQIGRPAWLSYCEACRLRAVEVEP